MAIVNQVTLIGNLGADAELRATGSGMSVLNFRMATTERFKTSDGERKEHTEWHRIVLWGNRAEALAPHLTKGTKIAITGKIRSNKYTDKNGVEKYTTDIHLEDLEFVGGSPGERPTSGANDARGKRQQRGQRQQEPSWAKGFDGGSEDDFPGAY